MSDPHATKTFAPDDALPPVEPPSAGFLVQLFVIPGVIVTIIVVVWLLFHWLASMGNDPREYVRKLRGNNEVRWQAAVNLAGALHGQAAEDITRDADVAGELGQILDEEITAGSMDERPINMRIYLCRALGEFRVEAAIAPLIRAVSTQRDQAEIAVRRAAVHGLASLAANLKSADPSWQSSEFVAALIAASKSDDDLLRSESAFALGVLDDPQALDRLDAMLDDPHPDARFNAATGLARHAKPAALPVLLEMVDPDQTLAMKEETSAGNRKQKRIIVNVNGLQGIRELATADPAADLGKAEAAVEKLTESDLPEVREKALRVRDALAHRGVEAK